jgi:hypothetical protein
MIAVLTLALQVHAAPFTQADALEDPNHRWFTDPNVASAGGIDINNANPPVISDAGITATAQYHYNAISAQGGASYPLASYPTPFPTFGGFDYQLWSNGNLLTEQAHGGVFAFNLPFTEGTTYSLYSVLTLYLIGGPCNVSGESQWADDLTFHGSGVARLGLDLQGAFTNTLTPGNPQWWGGRTPIASISLNCSTRPSSPRACFANSSTNIFNNSVVPGAATAYHSVLAARCPTTRLHCPQNQC